MYKYLYIAVLLESRAPTDTVLKFYVRHTSSSKSRMPSFCLLSILGVKWRIRSHTADTINSDRCLSVSGNTQQICRRATISSDSCLSVSGNTQQVCRRATLHTTAAAASVTAMWMHCSRNDDDHRDKPVTGTRLQTVMCRGEKKRLKLSTSVNVIYYYTNPLWVWGWGALQDKHLSSQFSSSCCSFRYLPQSWIKL